jgi:hypothetical protein
LNSLPDDFPFVVVGHLELLAVAIHHHFAEFGRVEISPLPAALAALRLGSGRKDQAGSAGEQGDRDDHGGR